MADVVGQTLPARQAGPAIGITTPGRGPRRSRSDHQTCVGRLAAHSRTWRDQVAVGPLLPRTGRRIPLPTRLPRSTRPSFGPSHWTDPTTPRSRRTAASYAANPEPANMAGLLPGLRNSFASSALARSTSSRITGERFSAIASCVAADGSDLLPVVPDEREAINPHLPFPRRWRVHRDLPGISNRHTRG